MSNDIFGAMQISASGMRAQGARLRVTSENMANADTTGTTPGADPYRRHTITFKNELDRSSGLDLVKVGGIQQDTKTPFEMRYIPDHPAADENGLVKMPNVNMLLEMMDAREAQRSYEANLGMIEEARAMVTRTIDLLRS
ncbi:MAG: flagellar basal body rod protein FlgC [Alphaproteobacteria bacterium]|nr:flagellar basal body rod protein FlgC [Alphaproteobacteria bacterium]